MTIWLQEQPKCDIVAFKLKIFHKNVTKILMEHHLMNSNCNQKN